MDSERFSRAYAELNQRFIRLVGDLSALRALSDFDLCGDSEDALLEGALRVLMDTGEFERCSVFLVEDDALVCRQGTDLGAVLEGHPRSGAGTHRFRIGEGIVGMAAETGNLQHCRDTRREVRFLHPEQRAEIGSLISVPVRDGERILGVINVSHSLVDRFADHHEHLLQAFANFLGRMLTAWRHRHRMEQELSRRTREFEHALVEARDLQRRYRELSIIDELTGIHNRRFFFPEAQAALANAVRHGLDFTVVMLDLDRFKEVNDRHGHAMGDKVLQVTAALIKGQTREGDIIARFGGEEFVLALPGTDLEGATRLAERMLRSLRAIAFSSRPEPLRVTASVGLASLDDDPGAQRTDLLESLLRRADQALYFSKASGRDRASRFADLPAPG